MHTLSVLLRKLMLVLMLDALLRFPLLSVYKLEDLRRFSLSKVNVFCELRVRVNLPARYGK